jgi:hypothetical protein
MPVGVSRALARAGIARFQHEAQGEVAALLSEQLQRNPGQDADQLSESAELIRLSAAELALMAAFSATGGMQIPPATPLLVTDSDMRTAILKSDNPLNLGEHPANSRISAYDVLTFGGDISKLLLIAGDWEAAVDQPSTLYTVLEDLETMHVKSGSRVAMAFAESGALRVQGLLWRVKLAVAGRPSFVMPLSEAIDEAVQALGIGLVP